MPCLASGTCWPHSYDWVRVPCATALWEIGGEAEAPAVLDTLRQAWERNLSTANTVVACLDRMGPAARPALPRLRSELHHTQRRGRYNSIDNDEKLQEISRTLIKRLTASQPLSRTRGNRTYVCFVTRVDVL